MKTVVHKSRGNSYGFSSGYSLGEPKVRSPSPGVTDVPSLVCSIPEQFRWPGKAYKHHSYCWRTGRCAGGGGVKHNGPYTLHSLSSLNHTSWLSYCISPLTEDLPHWVLTVAYYSRTEAGNSPLWWKRRENPKGSECVYPYALTLFSFPEWLIPSSRTDGYVYFKFRKMPPNCPPKWLSPFIAP